MKHTTETAGAPAPEGRRTPVLPSNYLRSCLLLLLLEGTAHGYQLAEQVGELGLPGADRGGVYRSLRGMEDDGLVVSSWEEGVGTPPRRTYQMTALGFEHLGQGADSLRQAVRHISAFLARLGAAEIDRPGVAA
ncbi:MAG: helix-turn-helix transcriptional regulator [Actinomycetota bacterium]|nr:helix-turn-helix transcriptional regulator [Actinomycetota bacterium]